METACILLYLRFARILCIESVVRRWKMCCLSVLSVLAKTISDPFYRGFVGNRSGSLVKAFPLICAVRKYEICANDGIANAGVKISKSVSRECDRIHSLLYINCRGVKKSSYHVVSELFL